MMKENLIFEIQRKIKENGGGVQSTRTSLEESMILNEEYKITPKKEAEPILESSFNASIHLMTEKSKKKIETKKVLVTEAFSLPKVSKKLQKDIMYFNYLAENFVPEAFKTQYTTLLESIFNDTVSIYQECDVTPRFFSQSVDTIELSEAQIVDLYKVGLNKSIESKYTRPMLDGTISELYESQIKDVTRKLIQEGSELEMQSVKTYLPFEETIYQFNKSILIPEIAQKPIDLFLESMTPEYKEFIQESPELILADLNKKIRLLTSMISPEMFNKAVDVEGIDAPKLAGISISVDKNFDDSQDEFCPDTIPEMDPEVEEEMQDEEEAQELEDAGEDIPEENLSGSDNPEELDMLPSESQPNEVNTFTNDSDVRLSGGNQGGTLPKEDAILPGGAQEDTEIEDTLETSPEDEIDMDSMEDDDLDEKALLETIK